MDLQASGEPEHEDREAQAHDEADFTRELEIKDLEDADAFLGGPAHEQKLDSAR